MNNKVKVLFCGYDHPADYVGGPNVWLSRTLPLLVKKGLEVHLFLLANCEVEQGGLKEWLEGSGVIVHSYVNKFFISDTIQISLDVVKKVKPDVYVPSLNLSACYAASLVKKIGIPTVGVLHSTDDFYIGLREIFLSKKDKLKDFNFTACVGISSQLVKTAKEEGADDIIYKYINYGCSLPEKKSEINDDSFKKALKLVYTGRIADVQKQICETTEGLCEVSKQVDGVTSEIIGDGPQNGQVRDIIKKHKCEDLVKFIGRVDPDKIFDHLLDSHVYIFLSDYEGLGLSLAEAMACGLVPICFNMPPDSGIYDLIKDNENGYVINDRKGELIDKIKLLKNDPKLWQKLSKNARNHIKNNMNIDLWADKWVDFIKELDKKSKKEKNWQSLNSFNDIKLPSVHFGFKEHDYRKNVKNILKIYLNKVIYHFRKFFKF